MLFTLLPNGSFIPSQRFRLYVISRVTPRKTLNMQQRLVQYSAHVRINGKQKNRPSEENGRTACKNLRSSYVTQKFRCLGSPVLHHADASFRFAEFVSSHLFQSNSRLFYRKVPFKSGKMLLYYMMIIGTRSVDTIRISLLIFLF